MDDWQSGGFGIYLHWPFCEAKCPYCDFNSYVRKEINQKQWLIAYLSELDRYAAECPERMVGSIFLGGGTPSLMDPDIVAALLNAIKGRWPSVNDLEVTLEANPSSVEAGRFEAYAQAGVNRISMGVQALNDRDLRKLGRTHTSQEAIQAYDIAKEKFNRVSFDLIYARQDQSLEAWRQELETALDMAVDHLSLYQLTIEPGTGFGYRYRQGKLHGLPDDATAADMYDITHQVCQNAGYGSYEVSNYAREGAESKHNLVYWRYGDYIGIGPGAHGRISVAGSRFATEAIRQPEAWLKAANSGTGEAKRFEIMASDQADEYLMMGLRLAEGINLTRYAKLAGTELNEDALDHVTQLGMVERSGDTLRATSQGRLVLNAVISELLAA